MSVYLRKYNVTLDGSTPGSLKIRIAHVKRDESAWLGSGDWTPASGDVKVSKDGGTEANIGTLPSYANGAWEYVLSGTELSAKIVTVRIDDAAVDLCQFTVETFGHASAMWAPDYTSGVRMGLTALPNAAADAAGGLPISDAGGLDLDTLLARLDAAISTRSTYAGADTSGTTTLLSRLSSARAGYLDNLNGHTPQTGDSYAVVNSGTHGNAAIKTLIDTLDLVADAIKLVTDRLDGLIEDSSGDRFTAKALEESPTGSGGGGDSAADIYDYFADGSRPDVFKADVSGLSTFDPLTDRVVLHETQSDYAPAKVGAAMTLSDGAITAAKFDESTAFPLAAADSGDTTVARKGSGSHTLKTLDDAIDGIDVPTPPTVEAISDQIEREGGPLDAVKGVTDKLDGLIEDSSGNRFTAKSLEQAPAGGGGDSVWTEEEKNDLIETVDTIETKVDGLSAISGSGSEPVSFVLLDTDDNPIEGLPLTLRDVSGNVAARGVSVDTGAVPQIESLDPATYKPDAHRSGLWQLVPGQSFVVQPWEEEGDNEFVVRMEALSSPSPEPGSCTLKAYCWDGPGVVVNALVLDGDERGNVYSGVTRQETSGSDSYVRFLNFPLSVRYRIWAEGTTHKSKDDRTPDEADENGEVLAKPIVGASS